MARYKLLGGMHYEKGTALPYAKGSIVETDRDLTALYPNHFEKIVEQTATVVTEERRKAVQELLDLGVWTEDDRSFLEQLRDADFSRVVRQSAPPVPTPKKAVKHSILGDDVTDNYQQAYDEGYKVWQNPQGKFQVTKGTTKRPLNETPLEAEQVEEFVSNHVKG